MSKKSHSEIKCGWKIRILGEERLLRKLFIDSETYSEIGGIWKLGAMCASLDLGTDAPAIAYILIGKYSGGATPGRARESALTEIHLHFLLPWLSKG